MSIVEWNIDKDKAIREAAKQAWLELKNMADEIKGLAQSRTPVDTGTLRGSAYIETDDKRYFVIVGFGGAASAYAARQHEDMSLHHDVGQAKFLESAFLEVTGRRKK